MLIKVIHIDDNPDILMDIEKILTTIPNIQYLGGYTNTEIAKENILKNKPELLIVDVELDNSGNTIFEFLKTYYFPCQIAILSGHTKYAYESYKIRATDYILKPATLSDIENLIDKARKNLIANNVALTADLLKDFINPTKQKPLRIQIVTAGKVHVEPLDEIEWVEADGNYTKFHKVDGSTIVSGKILKHYRTILDDSEVFLEISRSSCINLNLFRAIVRDGYKTGVQMKSGVQIPVSQLKKDEVMKVLTSIM